MGSEIFLVSNEASGDRLGALLIKALKGKRPDLEFTALGSQKMKEAGADIFFDIKNLSVMGVTEVVRKIPLILNLFKKIETYVRRNRPLVILIDAPDFNLRLAKKLKQYDVKIIYYVSPTIWVWRYNRVEIIKKYVDKMLVILPFEEEIYNKENVPVRYCGHPILEEYRNVIPKDPKTLNDKEIKILLMPGSRKFEVKMLLKEMIEACKIINRRLPLTKYIVSLSPNVDKKLVQKIIGNFKVEYTSSPISDFIKEVDFAIVKSGTSTLEVALFNVPMVILYKFSFLTHFIGKYVLFLKRILFGLPNIISGKEVVKELFQEEVQAEIIAGHTLDVITNNKIYNGISEDLANIKNILGEKDSSLVAAEEVLRAL